MAKKDAISCADRNCPFHGSLRTRGQVFSGTVIASKMSKTATIEWPLLKYLPKYQRYLKKKSRVKAHVPACISVKTGDVVQIAECRPIAKTVHFVVIKNPSRETEKGVK
jgi:small subunit ribosomal protein S17